MQKLLSELGEMQIQRTKILSKEGRKSETIENA